MIAVVVAALSLTLDVPYLPQTDQLCGGAAAAMVFRFLGDAHADVRSFEPLVDRRKGGIATRALTNAIARRGWNVEPFAGSIAALHDRLQRGEAIIVLLNDRRATYHYVVVVGATDDAVVVHDPSWGPWRPIANREFERAWKQSGFWSLVISGTPTGRTMQTGRASSAPADDTDRCSQLVDEAIGRIGSKLDSADAILEAVRAECPWSAAPLRELAGIRFAQKRWRDAADLARQALARSPDDAYAVDVLGSSLFMQDDVVGALEAWNRIGKPRVDRVRIEGIHHSRYQAVAAVLGLEAGDLLTADAFVRANRRLDELPDRTAARLSVRPQPDGYATIDVAVAERAAVPRQSSDWTGAAVAAAVDRQIDVAVPGFTGQGDVWSASWRWWTNRPSVSLAFDAPRVAGFGSKWRVDASWDEQTYSPGGDVLVRESRVHGGLTVSDWLRRNWRYAANVGVDSWNGARRAASIGGSVDRRLLSDRLALSGSATRWLSLTSGTGFGWAGAAANWRPLATESPWTIDANISAQRVGDGAPFGLWPGAGDGRARPQLLRAHPLLDDGIIQTAGAFGRTLYAASGETIRWFDTARPARLGVAMFVDTARASRALDSSPSLTQVDAGIGVRLRIPGIPRTLRIDAAHGLRDGANAITVGWTLPIAER